MAVVDPATLEAVDAVSRRRGLTRSGIIGEILADWAGKKGERAWPNSNLLDHGHSEPLAREQRIFAPGTLKQRT